MVGMTSRRAGAAAGADPRRLTVLFDRDCAFCVWTARQLRALDRQHHLEFVALQDAATRRDRPELVAAAGRYPLEAQLHVVAPDGHVAAGGEALLAILDRLPGGPRFRSWARLPTTRWLAALAYDLAAANRARLAGLVRAAAPHGCST